MRKNTISNSVTIFPTFGHKTATDNDARFKKNGAVRSFVFMPLLEGKESVKDEFPVADPVARLEEVKGLALAIHLEIITVQSVPLRKPNPATFFGKGRVEEIAADIKAQNIDLVVIDHALTPVQQRNLETEWRCKVIDRVALILEIFGERARTKEGVLQVELAHLNYQKGRLVRSWTHLERQRGGSGFLGGPGETQIEADRRILQGKITRIKRELARIVKTRQLHRAKRQKVPYPVIALVGYTNAGKSTLFNSLTGAEVLAENMLFATLDPTLRRIRLNPDIKEGKKSNTEQQIESKQPQGQTLILSDTVGFISHLPTHLIAAFRATLEEVTEADLIIHVRDISNPNNIAHKHDVVEILHSLGINMENPKKIIEVWNKVDLLPPETQTYMRRQAKNALLPTITVSALTGQGLVDLRKLIAQKALGNIQKKLLHLAAEELSLLDWLYRHGVQKQKRFTKSGGLVLETSLSAQDWRAFEALRCRMRSEIGLPQVK